MLVDIVARGFQSHIVLYYVDDDVIRLARSIKIYIKYPDEYFCQTPVRNY